MGSNLTRVQNTHSKSEAQVKPQVKGSGVLPIRGFFWRGKNIRAMIVNVLMDSFVVFSTVATQSDEHFDTEPLSIHYPANIIDHPAGKIVSVKTN